MYVDLLPPCNEACPTGENIQGYLAEVQAGGYEKAWRTLTVDNPFPAIHGRVCYHPCESTCNRRHLDAAVSIHAVERFLGDLALERGWRFDPAPVPTRQRVLVVGAGPAGLSAAYHLLRRGHEVEVRDAGPAPGGMMRYGIPAYRLPREVLQGEVDRLESLGAVFVSGHHVRDLEAERVEGRFDAVFVAVGAHLSKRIDIPAMDAGTMIDAVSFLRDVASGQPPEIGRKVAVYGGGNTALDAARTARRLGADEAVVVYRRTRDQMPAHEEETREAEREGVRLNWLRTVSAFDGGHLRVEIMELDESGRPRPTCRFETLDASSLILAVGQESDTELLRSVPGVEVDSRGTVRVSDSLMTGAPGVFAGGDMVSAERTVTVAVGHGRRAAREIDSWLRSDGRRTGIDRPRAGFATLNLWYFGDAAIRRAAELEPEQRLTDFSEVVGTLGPDDALYEAGRCLSCGNCCECDGCLGACPEDAVIKLGPGRRYRFDYDRCTGCRTCAEQCPVHAIDMVAEGQADPPWAFHPAPDTRAGL